MDCKWTEERVDELIMLLEERPCLYNTTLKDYFNRNSKRKALEEIATTSAIAGKLRLAVNVLIVLLLL